MWFSWVMLVVGLIVILVGCDIFTNSIEWLGKKLNLNEGVLGSIFAAVGTALPETLIPVVALILGATSGTGAGHANDVGLGAIIGAPFMLATVAMCVTGIAIYIFARRGRRDTVLKVNSRILSRDIRFFLLAFAIAVSMAFVENHLIRIFVAIGLVAYYLFYIYKHATDTSDEVSDEDAEELSPLHFAKKNPDPGLAIVVTQIVVGLSMIVGAAYLFVQYVSDVASSLGITPLILSLIIVPLATELPEKFNSVLWVRRSKDTLALGNVTGAMVFQSTLPVSIGIVFTEWRITPEYAPAFAQAVFAIIGASLLFFSMVYRGKLTARALVLAGVWYVAWIILVFPLDLEGMIRRLGWFS
ncbi:MAG: sodium:calcium antiporter [Chloroflexia bacterium]